LGILLEILWELRPDYDHSTLLTLVGTQLPAIYSLEENSQSV